MFCAVIQHAFVCMSCNTQANARPPDLHHKTSNSSCLKLKCEGLQPIDCKDDAAKMMSHRNIHRSGEDVFNNGTHQRYDNDVVDMRYDNHVGDMTGTHGNIHHGEDVFDYGTDQRYDNDVGERTHQRYDNDVGDMTHQRYDNDVGDIALVASLKVCAKKKDLHRGSIIHTHIIEKGLLKKNVFIGSALVSMYAKCGALEKAQEAFDEVSVQNAVLWNALITGYAQHGHGAKALNCFEQMQLMGFFPNAITFVCILKACGSIEALDKGLEIHAQIVKEPSLGNNILVANALIDMYAKCGALEKAQEVFNELLAQDIVSWTVLIAGYAQHGHGEEAISCFEQMQHAGFAPDAVTFSCILKACGSIGALEKGQKIHAQISREGLLETNIVVSNALIDMYAKCGALEKAQELFDKLSNSNAVSWNVLIAGYSRHGYGEEAWRCFEHMQMKGFFPDAVTYACILKACGTKRDMIKGEEVHAQILREQLLEKDIVLANALVDMYAKCGTLEKAEEVFDGLPNRDVVSWNALIAGYVQHGHSQEAVKCFDQMQVEAFSPNAVTFTSILKACSDMENLDKGQELHAQILREHSLVKDIAVANALVDLYAKCGSFTTAQQLFMEVSDRSTVSWNVLIAGYSQHGHYKETLNCFEQMCLEGFLPDAVTFSCVLKACSSIGALDKGQEIHAQVVKKGFLEREIVVANAVVDMYAKCGTLEKAQSVFDELGNRDIVSWNALIAGYIQHGYAKETLNCYEQMQRLGLCPDAVTFACILKACGTLEASDKGQLLHAQILQKSLLEKDTVLASALVTMYAQCGVLEKAQNVFEELSIQNVVIWTALINGYAQHGLAEEALECFERMHLGGFSPNAVTFACILRACGSLGAAYRGQKLHAVILRHEFLEKDLVDVALIVMYAKCGMLSQAQGFFDKLLVRDVVSWSALLGGYSQLGKDEIVLSLFDKMVREGIEPDHVAFTIVLNTCSHRGLVDEGQVYFEMISKAYGIIPTSEHHTCMIDLFSRAGHLDKAVAVIEKMPRPANLIVWENLLGACQKWGNMKLGRWVFEHAEQLDGKDAATYVYMSNIYAAAGTRKAKTWI